MTIAPIEARPTPESGIRPGDGRRPAFPDLVVVAAGVALVVAAALEGRRLLDAGVNIFLFFPPLLAWWVPHAGPGTAPAVLVAVVVVVYGPSAVARMRWRTLLASAWAAGFAWTLSLALIDGWQDGVVIRLTESQEYLHDLPRITEPGFAGLGQMLSIFSGHVLTNASDRGQMWSWTTHVGAHPPGAFGVFLLLDRLGLSGGGPAGIFVILLWSSAAVAAAVTLRALKAEGLARRALPFAVLFPGAVWAGVSADGMFAAVLAWGVALLALAAARPAGREALALAAGGGVLLSLSLYLSYGLAVAGLIPLAVLVATRRWRLLLPAVGGGAVVVAAFTAAGFWWPDGFEKVQLVYAASITRYRPDDYFLWANIAALLIALGPAVVAGLRRLAARPHAVPLGYALLVGAVVVVVGLADASGLSKGEVERIWLPFGVWLVLACGLLPRRQVRGWLVVQALLALAVNHLLVTPW